MLLIIIEPSKTCLRCLGGFVSCVMPRAQSRRVLTHDGWSAIERDTPRGSKGADKVEKRSGTMDFFCWVGVLIQIQQPSAGPTVSSFFGPPKVEEKAPEAPKAAGPEVKEVKAEKAEVEESKKNKIPEAKEAKKQSAPKVQPKAPVPPGAQTSTTLTPKQPPKAAPGAKKKVQQPGPPQQPGLITPESGKKGGKGEKGEKGKGGKKGGAGGGFPGIQLCVRNLAKEATPEQLKSMFAPFGELLSVDVKKNTDQTCRGYGFVTFAKMEDAKKAIGQMDNKQVEGKNLVVVLSDRQQGTTKAEREAQVTTKGGKGKDVKGDAKGKGGKGKAKGAPPAPAPPAPGAAPAWPSQAPPEASYPYNYGGYPMVSPMAAYANQGYPNSQQAAAIAMQASILQAQQQAIQSQAAWYSTLSCKPLGLTATT